MIEPNVLLAGLAGGAISGAIMPGPLAALDKTWLRVAAGALCGAVIAFFCAHPLVKALQRPDYLDGIALLLGVFGLSFLFKLLKAWDAFDLSGVVQRAVDKILGRIGL